MKGTKVENLSPEALKIVNDFTALAQYQNTPIFEKFIYSPKKILALFAGNQCLAGETGIYDPVSDETRRVGDIREDFHVLAWNGEALVPAIAKAPFIKPAEILYSVSLASGESFLSTGGHRILSRQGWTTVSELQPGFAVFHPQSNSDISRSVRGEGGPHCFGKGEDSQYCCRQDFCSHDAQPRLSPSNDPIFSPSQERVPPHRGPASSPLDAPGCTHTSNLLVLSALPSSQGGLLLPSGLGAGILSHAFCTDQIHTYGKCQVFPLPPNASCLPPLQDDEDPQSANAWVDDLCGPHDTSLYSLVTNITGNRVDVTYDFHVPIYNNYYAAGVIHRNSGKTAAVVRSYIFRFLSFHPVASKNFNWLQCRKHPKRHRVSFCWQHSLKSRVEKVGGKDTVIYSCGGRIKGGAACDGDLEVFVSPFRKVRFASENLPLQNAVTGSNTMGGSAIEVRNTQYPELIKWCPRYLIKKDINQRTPVMVIKDIFGGPDIIVEFVSYNQDVQAMAGVQLASFWADEEPPHAFLEEMRMRLLATDGDCVVSLTPANRLTYVYDEIYTQAAEYFRSAAICKEFDLDPYEKTESKKSIAVFQMATDDNPTLDPQSINRIMEDIDVGDPDVIAVRRYGIFKAVSSSIFKAFNYQIHYLSMEKWFPSGVPESWLHARSIDYHPVVPLAIIYVSLSPTNEAFVWWEASPDPTRTSTDEIALSLAKAAREYRFKIDRIDPLANVKQQRRTAESARTTSVREDLNEYLRKHKTNGIGTGGAFLGFDTKNLRGREQVKIRLKNSRDCGEPFNNRRQDEQGNFYHLPTLWIMDTCPQMAKSLKMWRLEEHGDLSALVTKDARETPQQKWSHFPTALEGIFKEEAFRPPLFWDRPDDRNRSMYFSGRQGGNGAALHDGVRGVPKGFRVGVQPGGTK